MSDDYLNEERQDQPIQQALPKALNTVQLGMSVGPPPDNITAVALPTHLEDIEDEEPVSVTEQIFVLQHLAMELGLYARTADIIEEIKYFSNSTNELVIELAGSIILYMEAYEDRLPSRQMIMHMHDMYYPNSSINTKASLGNVMDEWYDGIEKILDVEYVQDRLYALLKQYRKKSMLMQGVSKTDDTFKDSLEAYQAAVEKNPFKKVKRTNPYESLDSLTLSVDKTTKYPTGVWFFDDAMGDGAMAGEAIGVLAPPSGGKTTCAMELVYAQCYGDEDNPSNYIAHISTEQGIEGDLSIRAMALVTHKHRGYFEGGIRHWSEAERVELHAKMANFNEYHYFFDYTQVKPTSIEELLQPVEDMIAEGKRPIYVIIDWWGAIKDAMIVEMQKTNNLGDNDVRRRSRVWLDKITKKCKAIGVVPIIFHQLSGAAAGKKGGSIASGQDAQEDKQWENYFDFNLVFGPKDGDKNFTINPSKARRTDNTVINANLNGGYCKIDKAVKSTIDLAVVNGFVAGTVKNAQINEEYG